ncbi:hypothetical protein [Streptomyces sp. NBC_01334]|uniref:hypothetical protein n=1 Tax=Streptomyces sp. NBC_01334 TaxID=2903827 RepID=UPI002E12A568|nr:hypothetical protein OG736_05345 [Streptomyces sp. NBC_01334]
MINSERATFLDKGQQSAITVDGSGGARLNPRDGVLLQMIELDDPGPVNVGGRMMNVGVYTEPTTDPVRNVSFDVTAVHSADGAATFTAIDLEGDFYNGMRSGKNMVLAFEGATLKGVISATKARHRVPSIDASTFYELGIVTNTVRPAVNNGAIVRLGSGSVWTVTGTSCLTSLTLAADAVVKAPRGRRVTLAVDGTPTALTPGATYAGALTLTVA